MPSTPNFTSPVMKLRLLYVTITVIFGIFVARAFYMQVIQHDYYKNRALSTQLKQYEIPAERGTILAHDGDSTISLVLNQKLYTIYADPTLVKTVDVDKITQTLAKDLSIDESMLKELLTQKDTRFTVLKRKASQAEKNAVIKHEYAGIGGQEQTYRTYPQGAMASQLLGIVDDSGTGRYGIEQALNKTFTGTPGELKAVTDIKGVPLAANKDNVSVDPIAGKDTLLTLEIGMQKQLENIVAAGAQNANAEQASAIIMDVNTGAIKAMANYPSYDPSNLQNVHDANLFNNVAVTGAIEPGSIMKALTVAAALDSGVANKNTSYYDPAQFEVDEAMVKNVEEDGGPQTRTISDILTYSLNTGATWVLMQMGDGQINNKGRTLWHNYMTDHYGFGQETGIEQGYEATGYVPGSVDSGSGINITYANTTFGQAMTATPVQMAAALTSVLNGGTYYQPRLVDGYVDGNGRTTTLQPKKLREQVVSPGVTTDLSEMLIHSFEHIRNPKPFDQSRYSVGGKTGTAEIAESGGYSRTEFNGTYMGYVGGDKPQYAIVVYTIKPKVKGYAGTTAAKPIFNDLAHMLINNSYVTPRT